MSPVGWICSKPLLVSCLLTSHWLMQVTWLRPKSGAGKHIPPPVRTKQIMWPRPVSVVEDIHVFPMKVQGEGREFENNGVNPHSRYLLRYSVFLRFK